MSIITYWKLRLLVPFKEKKKEQIKTDNNNKSTFPPAEKRLTDCDVLATPTAKINTHKVRKFIVQCAMFTSQ